MAGVSQSYVNGTAVGGAGTALGSGTPTTSDAGSAAVGTASTASHSDHKHTISVGAPSALTYGGAGANGTATSLARSDHVHALAAPTTVGVAGSTSTYLGGSTIQRTATAASYNVTSGDYYIGVTSTAAARTITLPSAAAAGRVFIVKDESGAAGTNNITVTVGTGSIDGSSNKVININYGSSGFVSDGTNYFAI